jgi:hypothetical protein
MTYPKTVAQVTEYSIDEKGIKRITFQTAQEYAEYIKILPSNVYLIEAQDAASEIETLLGCMEIEDKYSRSLGTVLEDMKELSDEKTGIYALDNEQEENN